MVRAGRESVPRILRMGHPLAFAAFLRQIGAPADLHFRRQGLPTTCEDPDAFVPLQAAWALFDSAARSVDPSLGWHVGRFVGDHNLNRTLLSKLEHAPTLYEALTQFVRLSSAEASHLQLGIRERGDDLVLFTHYPDMKGVSGYHVSQSYQLGVILGVIRHFTGKDWIPGEIGIENPVAPAVAEEFFPGCRVATGRRVGYVTIPRSCLHLPASRCDSGEDDESPLLLTKDFDYLDTLRVVLTPHLTEGYPDTSLAASLMGTSVRTLARRLSDSDLAYRTFIDRIRFEEARKLLENTTEPITEVAGAVGFDDSSNFARMFRRIAGISPREFRRIQRHQQHRS